MAPEDTDVETNEMTDDAALFAQATARDDEPADPPAEPEPAEPAPAPEPEPAPQRTPRDALGRFASQQAEPDPEPDPQDPQDDQPSDPDGADDKKGFIPAGRVKEMLAERDAKLEAATQQLESTQQVNATQAQQLGAFQEQLKQLQEQMQRLNQPDEPNEPEEDIDPLADPNGFSNRLAQRFSGQLQERDRIWSERLAIQQHGKELVDEAYEWFKTSAEPLDRQKVLESIDPFSDIVQKYREYQVIREIGDDPQSYVKSKVDEALVGALSDPGHLAQASERLLGDEAHVQKIAENLLKDPGFLSRALEAAQAVAAQQTTAPSRPAPQNPPSVNQMQASGVDPRPARMQAMDDPSLFQEATRR